MLRFLVVAALLFVPSVLSGLCTATFHTPSIYNAHFTFRPLRPAPMAILNGPTGVSWEMTLKPTTRPAWNGAAPVNVTGTAVNLTFFGVAPQGPEGSVAFTATGKCVYPVGTDMVTELVSTEERTVYLLDGIKGVNLQAGVFLKPLFAPHVPSYTIPVLDNATAVNVTARLSLEIPLNCSLNGVPVVDAQPAVFALTGNTTMANLTVTNGDSGSDKTISLAFVKGPQRDQNNQPAALVGTVALSPPFAPNITAYTANVAYNVRTFAFNVTTQSPLALVFINDTNQTSGVPSSPFNLTLGVSAFRILIVADDGSFRAIQVTVTRTPALISSLNIVGSVPSQVFNDVPFPVQVEILDSQGQRIIEGPDAGVRVTLTMASTIQVPLQAPTYEITAALGVVTFSTVAISCSDLNYVKLTVSAVSVALPTNPAVKTTSTSIEVQIAASKLGFSSVLAPAYNSNPFYIDVYLMTTFVPAAGITTGLDSTLVITLEQGSDWLPGMTLAGNLTAVAKAGIARFLGLSTVLPPNVTYTMVSFKASARSALTNRQITGLTITPMAIGVPANQLRLVSTAPATISVTSGQSLPYDFQLQLLNNGVIVAAGPGSSMPVSVTTDTSQVSVSSSPTITATSGYVLFSRIQLLLSTTIRTNVFVLLRFFLPEIPSVQFLLSTRITVLYPVTPTPTPSRTPTPLPNNVYVSTLYPVSGVMEGFTPVQFIIGSGFLTSSDAIMCKFGSLPIVNGLVDSSSTLTCLSPPSSISGDVTVVVSRNGVDLQSNTLKYTYLNTTSAALCPDTARIFCGNNCVAKFTDCPTASACSTGIKCWDGSCAPSLQDCPPISSCPIRLPQRCLDGTCIEATGTCFKRPTCSALAVACPDGLCANSYSVCTPFFGCPADKSVMCPDGGCVSSFALCAKSSGKYVCFDGTTADTIEKCPNPPSATRVVQTAVLQSTSTGLSLKVYSADGSAVATVSAIPSALSTRIVRRHTLQSDSVTVSVSSAPDSETLAMFIPTGWATNRAGIFTPIIRLSVSENVITPFSNPLTLAFMVDATTFTRSDLCLAFAGDTNLARWSCVDNSLVAGTPSGNTGFQVTGNAYAPGVYAIAKVMTYPSTTPLPTGTSTPKTTTTPKAVASSSSTATTSKSSTTTRLIVIIVPVAVGTFLILSLVVCINRHRTLRNRQKHERQVQRMSIAMGGPGVMHPPPPMVPGMSPPQQFPMMMMAGGQQQPRYNGNPNGVTPMGQRYPGAVPMNTVYLPPGRNSNISRSPSMESNASIASAADFNLPDLEPPKVDIDIDNISVDAGTAADDASQVSQA